MWHCINREPPVFVPYVSSIADHLLIYAWVAATGGYQSPFFTLLFVAVVGVALRYNQRATLVGGVLSASGYTLTLVAVGGIQNTTQVVVRCGTLLLAAAVAGEVARGSVQHMQAKAELLAINEQLQRLDELKNRIVSNASHELRTPLTSIRAFSELLADDQTLDDTARQAKCLPRQ